MKIKGRNKMFSITIDEYEFKTSSFKEDLDWLNITVEVIDENLKWSNKGAFIRSEELPEILDLFKGNIKSNKVKFLEKDMMFSFENNVFIVSFIYSLHPKNENYDPKIDSSYKLSFDLNEKQVEKIVDSVEHWIALFPVRADLSK
jgi:hypothetical protein